MEKIINIKKNLIFYALLVVLSFAKSQNLAEASRTNPQSAVSWDYYTISKTAEHAEDLLKNGKSKEALDAIEDILDLTPAQLNGILIGLLNRNYFFFELTKLFINLDLPLKKISKFLPDDIRNLCKLVELLIKKGRSEDIKLLLKKAFELDWDYTSSRFHELLSKEQLFELLWKRGEYLKYFKLYLVVTVSNIFDCLSLINIMLIVGICYWLKMWHSHREISELGKGWRLRGRNIITNNWREIFFCYKHNCFYCRLRNLFL